MSDRNDQHRRDETDLERALRDLPAPRADDAFRDRLREAFASGSIVVGRARPRWPSFAAAAALLLAAGLAILLPRGGPEFLVFDATGAGSVWIDGTEVPVEDRDRLAAALRPGASVRVSLTVTLALVVPDTALFELAGGTRMTLPANFGTARSARGAGRVDQGEVRFVSGPGFSGRRMTLFTPDGIVVVTGTALSVQCDDRGTCVCVLEGTARVGVDAADLEDIPPGRRKVMPRGGAPSISPVAPVHREDVERFLERASGRLGRE